MNGAVVAIVRDVAKRDVNRHGVLRKKRERQPSTSAYPGRRPKPLRGNPYVRGYITDWPGKLQRTKSHWIVGCRLMNCLSCTVSERSSVTGLASFPSPQRRGAISVAEPISAKPQNPSRRRPESPRVPLLQRPLKTHQLTNPPAVRCRSRATAGCQFSPVLRPRSRDHRPHPPNQKQSNLPQARAVPSSASKRPGCEARPSWGVRLERRDLRARQHNSTRVAGRRGEPFMSWRG